MDTQPQQAVVDANVRPRKRRRVVALQLAATLGLIGFMLHSVSVQEVLQLQHQLTPGYLAVSALLVVVTALFGAASLQALFAWPGPWLWRRQFAFDYLYVQALCQLTPAQMGEAALPYVAGRGRFSPGEIAAALVVQRMTALFIVVTAALLGAGRWAAEGYLWTAAGAVLALCTLLAALIAHRGVRGWLNARIGRRFGPVLAGFYDAWRAMLSERPAQLLLHLALMVMRFCLSVAGNYAVFSAFSIHVPFAELAALSALAILASLAPLTINGAGITEGVFVLALTSYGNSAEAVLAACLAGRLIAALVMGAVAVGHTALNARTTNLQRR